MRRGFTLIELLVVILIIGLVTVVALPTVLPAIAHRQMSEAGRILQGAIVGARDKAIHDGQPSGIRLLPDPAWPLAWTAGGTIDPTVPLAWSRIVPIEPAPEYSEGMVSIYPGAIYSAITNNVPYLVLEAAPFTAIGAPNSPTSWYWNIRVGDRIQINNAGPWYTVVGPRAVQPNNGNPEFFTNVGPPGSTLPVLAGSGLQAEYLLLANGTDDDANGFVDEGWDGVDNDGDGMIDETRCAISAIGEWELESWRGSLGQSNSVSIPYTIRRRPVVASGAREVALPTEVVIDATTGLPGGTMERSRLPMDVYGGSVDIMVNPDGSVFYSTPYAVPTSMGLGRAFCHFWLAERQDVVAPNPAAAAAPMLPIAAPGGSLGTVYPPPYLKGSYSVLTLFARTGQVVVNANPAFLDGSGNYNALYPFLGAEQGASSP